MIQATVANMSKTLLCSTAHGSPG